MHSQIVVNSRFHGEPKIGKGGRVLAGDRFFHYSPYIGQCKCYTPIYHTDRIVPKKFNDTYLFKLLQLADAHPMSISIKIYAFIRSPTQHTVQLNLNFTHACGYTQARTRFSCVKVYNVECIYFVACRFVVRTRAIKQLVLPSCTTRIS